MPRWSVIAVALAFAVLFLLRLWDAVSNLLAWLTLAALTNRTLSAVLWIILALGLLLPVVGYVAALVITRRRRLSTVVIGLAVAYCVVQALNLSVLAFYEGVISG